QLRERDVHPESAGAAAPFGHPFAEFPRQRRGVDQVEIEQPRVQIGDDGRGANRLATFRDYSNGASTLDDDFAHAACDANFRAAGRSRFRHRLRDRSHSAYGVTPHSLLPVHLAEAVMEQDIRRPRAERTGVMSDDAVEPVKRLDGIALEPALEILARRGGE